MDNSEACKGCGSNTRTLHSAVDKKDYCECCFKSKWPPTLLLMKFTAGNMFNIETGVYESIEEPEDLMLCGWEVKMIQELPTGNALVYMEYFGDAACGRCEDYKIPLKGCYCLSQACSNHKEKKAPQDRVYPQWPSFYLNWKYGGKRNGT